MGYGGILRGKEARMNAGIIRLFCLYGVEREEKIPPDDVVIQNKYEYPGNVYIRSRSIRKEMR